MQRDSQLKVEMHLLLCYQNEQNHLSVYIVQIFHPYVYCLDKPETNEEFKKTLPVETESHPAITSGSFVENVVIVLLKFEIMEVQQPI